MRDPGEILLAEARHQRKLAERPARRQVQHGKADDRNDEQQHETLQQAAEQEVGHRHSPSDRAAGWGNSALSPRHGRDA